LPHDDWRETNGPRRSINGKRRSLRASRPLQIAFGRRHGDDDVSSDSGGRNNEVLSGDVCRERIDSIIHSALEGKWRLSTPQHAQHPRRWLIDLSAPPVERFQAEVDLLKVVNSASARLQPNRCLPPRRPFNPTSRASPIRVCLFRVAAVPCESLVSLAKQSRFPIADFPDQLQSARWEKVRRFAPFRLALNIDFNYHKI
jgi:hypothetical protein